MIARNCDWFMALFVPVVIGHLKTALLLGIGITSGGFDKTKKGNKVQKNNLNILLSPLSTHN